MGSVKGSLRSFGAMAILGSVFLVYASDMDSFTAVFPSRWRFYLFVARSFGLRAMLGTVLKLSFGCKVFYLEG